MVTIREWAPGDHRSTPIGTCCTRAPVRRTATSRHSRTAAAGYSTQLLLKHIRSGRVTRVRRGVYRLVHFPAGEHENLAVLWLWSERMGVFSHHTALALHGLSD